MTDIGHNQPPPVDAMGLHVEDLFQLVSDTLAGVGAVKNDEQDAALDGLLDEFRKARKDADEHRAAEKRPYDEAAKAVQAKWKPLLDRCDMATAEIKAKLTPYRNAKIAAREEAVRIARETAEQKQKAAQDALRQSDDLEARFTAEEQLKEAARLTAAANRADRTATGLRTSWVAEVTDRRAALNHYLREQPEMFERLIQDLADKDARNEATRRNIPGIVFHQKKEAA
jgi:uncharacterized protein with ATP-grasp and redox domains